jgi:hypothetical protein
MKFKVDDDFDRATAIQMLATARSACERMMRHAPGQGPAKVKKSRLKLLDWAKKFLPHYLGDSTTDLHLWVCDWCDRSVENRDTKINLMGPRDTAKSVYVTTAHVLRSIVEQSESLVWIICETKEQAQAQLEHIKRELEENELLAHAYPWAHGKGAVWRVNRIVTRNGLTIEAFGAGQKIRGRRAGSNRPSLVILDDIQSNPVITSPDRRNKDWDWLQSAVMKAGSPRTNFFNLANALHREAIGSRLTKTAGWTSSRWRSIMEWPDDPAMKLWGEWSGLYHQLEDPDCKQKARAFYEARKPTMDRGVKLLWPDRHDLYSLMCLREEGGHSTFEREKQTREINPEECEWGDQYFPDSIWFHQWPKEWRAKALACDPSKGKSDKVGDYSAFVKVLLGGDGLLYVQADLARRPVARIVEDGVKIVREFQPGIFGLETNMWQELLCAPFDAGFVAGSVLPPPIIPIENMEAKEVRIRRLDPWLTSHKIRFKADCPSTALLVQMLQDFPIGDHDDGPDALEMAIRVLLYMLGVGSVREGRVGSIV